MWKEETKFQVGDECMFDEDGGILRCKILARRLDSKENTISFTLGCLQVVRRPAIPFAGQAKAGERFSVSKVLGVCIPGALWQIYEL